MGISEATFYNWKEKFACLGVMELRVCDNWRMKSAAEEKKLVADLSLDKEMLQ